MSHRYQHDNDNYLNKDHVFHHRVDKVFEGHLLIKVDVLFQHHLLYYLKVDQYRKQYPLVLKYHDFLFF